MPELPIGGQVALSPDQIAQATPAELPIGGQVKLSSDQATQLRKDSGQFDPLQDFSPDQLAELQKQNPDFSILHEYSARPELQEMPGMNQKIADAYHLGRVNGSFLDKYKGETKLETAGNVAKAAGATIWETAKGFGKQAWNYAQALATPVGAMVTAPFTTPETTEGMFQQAQRQVAENIAGTETGLFGLGKTVAAGGDVVARKIGLEKPLEELTPEEKQAELFGALRDIKKQQAISTGRGPILEQVGSEIVPELEKAGVPVRPEEVAATAAGDPFSWYAMGSAFHGIGGAVPKSVSARAARATEAAGQFAEKVGGKTVETAADIAKLGTTAAAKVAPLVTGAIGAAKGSALHGPAGSLIGAGAGYKAGQKIAEGLTKVSGGLEKLSGIGEQIAGAKPMVSPIAQLGKDVLSAAPGAAVEAGKGLGFDLGLVAATSEESPEEKAGIGLGTVFGALGAAKRVGGRVLSGQIIAPRAYGPTAPVSSSGNFPAFDTMHSAAIQAAEPGVVTRLNAIRSFLKGAAPGTDLFLAKDEATLASVLKQAGFTDEQAKLYAGQNGFFTTALPDKNGVNRPVIVAKHVEAAPHEAFHAIQDVLGEDANRKIDVLTRQAYEGQWDPLGEDYARRFAQFDPNKTWRENILDLSGWGRAEAAEKISRDAYNKLSAQQGGEPSAADVHQEASAEWDRQLADAAKRNPGVPLDQVSENAWRDILSPEEASGVADRYLARELAAENFDAVFKHSTGGNEKLIPRLANIVGNLVSAVGGEPLAGRESEVGKVPLKFEVTKKVGEVLPKPEILPPGQPEVAQGKVPAGIPATSEGRQQAAAEARTLADSAPVTAPVTGATANPNLPATKSPREILGAIAEAIAQRTGVKINYLSAPDEPAAATTSKRPVRRAIIEAFRSMPVAARALWEKTFFPERVIKLKGDRYQILGWAPEVFASNAHKLARTLADTGVASPYEIDAKNRTFTEQGWKDLFADVQTFVENQGLGRTGAGEKMVVPAGTVEKGFTAPRVEGAGTPLDQRKADFINLLFHEKLPETTRLRRDKFPLNVAGQDVSAATKPGRISVPVRPRGKFAGETAELHGVEGREIMEVNPVRAEIERAAQKAGIPMPDLIEANQRLALEHINDVVTAPEAPNFRGNTLTLTAGFQPPAEAMESLKTEPGEKLKPFRGKYGPGGTGWAYEVGAKARTLEDLKAFRDARNLLQELGSAAMKAKDFNSAMDLFTRAQYAREAYEWATGVQMDNNAEAGSAESSRKNFKDDPAAAPPVPGGESGAAKAVPGELQAAQFSPSKAPKAIKAAAVRDEQGRVFEGPIHVAAYTKAMEAGVEARDLLKMVEGFTTNSGEFLNRKEAFKRAQENEQVLRVFPTQGSLIAEHMAPLGKAPVDRDQANFSRTRAAIEEAQGTQFQPGENPVEDLAKEYADEAGVTYAPPAGHVRYNRDLAKRLAAEYDTRTHSPNDPAVKKSYDAFTQETLDQFQKIQDAGYTLEPISSPESPYKNGMDALRDVNENKHLFFNTSETFGQEGQNLENQRMLEPAGFEINGKPMLVNDIFRAVHDFFGHARRGLSFGPRGEFNAWREHSALYSEEAQGALAAETIGQTAWTQLGPHLLNEKGELRKPGEPGFAERKTRPYAEQKNIIMPPELVAEARAQFQPQEEKKSRTGLEFKQFFSDVTSGKFGKSEVPFTPVQDLSDVQHIVDSRSKYTGHFEDHIHKSIPTLYEEKTRSIDAVVKSYPDGATLLDIAGSEGDYGKSISEISEGKIKTVTLDPNPEMARVFREKPQAPGATYAEESFGFPFTDPESNKVYPQHKGKYDVINEAAGFQFIDPDREGQIAEVKRLLKPDGLFLSVEKVKNPDWKANEKFKDDNFKNKYFSTEELKAKDARVGFQQSKQESKSVGMLDNMAEQAELERVLSENFKHVTQYWDSGNFKGYAASDNPEVVQKFVDNAGDLNSKFSTVETPRKVQFAPKKEKEEFKFRRASGVSFSKAWILPNGTPMQLGGQWHRDALNENEALREKYNIPVSEGDEENRKNALQKGFARVNYDTRNGLLTVEARASDWRKLKPSVEKLVEANLNDIDRMTVHLLNPKVDKVVDSETGTLFDKDKPAEKMQNIPFVTLSEPRSQFQPFADKDFESELDKIRAGKSGGQTFTTAGAVWTPKNPKVDIVSLASVNVPQGELTPESFREAVAPYQDLLSDPNIVAGAFSFSKDGTPTVSIDINAVVPQKYRENTLKFAKANDQRSIWDVDKSDTVDTGGKGNTRLNTTEEILDALDPLLRGKAVPVDDILKQNTAGAIEEQSNLFGAKELTSSAALGAMTKAELAQRYPEAVIPRRKGEVVSSSIMDSPLAKEAGSEEAAIDAFARRLVEFAKEYKDNPIYKAGAKWYQDFVPQLKKQFGPHAQIMAELLAATSPRTDVASNYAYALDALEGFKSGRFKKQITKFEEGLEKIKHDDWESWYKKELKAGNIPNPPAEPTPAAFMEHWIFKNNLKPTQSNGKLYGTHSIRLLQVFARRWNDLNTGPKTRTFVSNLLGTGHDATIDVWADRTMRRLGYSGFADRWRILPQNAAPVSDADFYFSQKAFAKAAAELGLKADALQGALWFAEKDHWSKNGWARLDLGSFQTELAKTDLLTQGIRQRSAAAKAEKSAKPAETMELGISVEPRKLK